MNKTVTRNFLENVDYLRELSKEISKRKGTDLDSNLIYEVAYADVLLDDLIIQNHNMELSKELTDIQGVFKMILDSIPEEAVLASHEKFDYRNILKTRYKNLDDASYIKECAYTANNSFGSYFKQKIVSTVPLLFTVFLIFSGVFTQVTSRLIDVFSDILGIEPRATTEVVLNAESTSAVSFLGNAVNTLIGILFTVTVIFLIITTALDIIYINFPKIRNYLSEYNFISDSAKLATKESFGDSNVMYKSIKSYDRIERNMSWLNSMIDILSKDNIDELLLTELNSLKSEIESCKKLSLKYKLYARIEFLHDKFIERIKDNSIIPV